MREILFRGKRRDNGEWIVGQLIRYEDGRARIVESGENIFCYEMDTSIIQTVARHVAHETVGQYTGLCDKNGKEIFEGDILKISWSAPRRETVYENHEVVYSKSGFFTKRNGKLAGQVSNYISPNVNMRCEVIGNIHDNPEPLEVSHGVQFRADMRERAVEGTGPYKEVEK